MRRADIDGDDEAQGSCGANIPAVSRPAARGAVIPFNRKAETSAVSGFAAGGDPPSPPATFIELGQAVSAVVLRIRNSRLHVQAIVPDLEEEGIRDDR